MYIHNRKYCHICQPMKPSNCVPMHYTVSPSTAVVTWYLARWSFLRHVLSDTTKETPCSMNTYVLKRNLWLPVCSCLLFYETQWRRSTTWPLWPLLMCGSDHSGHRGAVVVVSGRRQADHRACLLIHRPESWSGEPVIHTATWVQRLQLFNEVRFHSVLLRTVTNWYEASVQVGESLQTFWNIIVPACSGYNWRLQVWYKCGWWGEDMAREVGRGSWGAGKWK